MRQDCNPFPPPHLPHAHHPGRARRWARTLALAGAAGLLAACGGGGERPAEVTGAVVADGAIDARLVGAWRVLGEGSLLEVRRDGVAQYQEAKTLCYPDTLGSTDEVAALPFQSFRLTTDRGRTTAELFELDGLPAALTLARIDEVPPSCRAAPRTDAATTLRALCELMELDYAFSAERRIDWPARCAALAPAAAAATDDDALQAVLEQVLAGSGDAHLNLYRGSGEERQRVFNGGRSATLQGVAQAFGQQSEVDDLDAFKQAWGAQLKAQIDAGLAGGGRALNGALRWGRLEGGVGYLGLTRMMRFSDDPLPATDVRLAGEAIDEALAGLADTKALIVDVSLNGGGYDAVSAEVAARFADRPRLAFTKHWHRPQGLAAQPWSVAPKGPQPYRRPVYLLTSDLTGSAAEAFTMMMRRFPQVVHAGQATAGAISDILDKPLPGNFGVTFASQAYIDPDGVLFEVTGIPPRLPLTLFDAGAPQTLFTGHWAAVTALAAIAAR